MFLNLLQIVGLFIIFFILGILCGKWESSLRVHHRMKGIKERAEVLGRCIEIYQSQIAEMDNILGALRQQKTEYGIKFFLEETENVGE